MDETCICRRFIPMEQNGPTFIVRRRACGASSAIEAIRARAVEKFGRLGRSHTSDDRAGASLARAMGAGHPARQLALPDHAQAVDRYGSLARAAGGAPR